MMRYKPTMPSESSEHIASSGSTSVNIKSAIKDEKKANADYLHHASVATMEGQGDAAQLMTHIATEERKHKMELQGALHG